MPYIELHASSAFSFLRGASFPEQLAETAARLEMPAMALLDRNGVYGAQRFAVAAREKNVRPIVGSELSMEDGGVLPVLVQNRTGYKNLCELLTQAHLRSEKGSCLVRWDELAGFASGLIALVGSGSGSCRSALAGNSSPRSIPFGEAPNGAREGACAPRIADPTPSGFLPSTPTLPLRGPAGPARIARRTHAA